MMWWSSDGFHIGQTLKLVKIVKIMMESSQSEEIDEFLD
jgi:hypothetical protein